MRIGFSRSFRIQWRHYMEVVVLYKQSRRDSLANIKKPALSTWWVRSQLMSDQHHDGSDEELEERK